MVYIKSFNENNLNHKLYLIVVNKASIQILINVSFESTKTGFSRTF